MNNYFFRSSTQWPERGNSRESCLLDGRYSGISRYYFIRPTPGLNLLQLRVPCPSLIFFSFYYYSFIFSCCSFSALLARTRLAKVTRHGIAIFYSISTAVAKRTPMTLLEAALQEWNARRITVLVLLAFCLLDFTHVANPLSLHLAFSFSFSLVSSMPRKVLHFSTGFLILRSIVISLFSPWCRSEFLISISRGVSHCEIPKME